MSNKHDYTIVISGHEVLVEHPGGIRTWEHPGRDSQLARVTAILTRDPDCVVVHDQEMDVSSGPTGRRRVRQVLLHATRDPAAAPLFVAEPPAEISGVAAGAIGEAEAMRRTVTLKQALAEALSRRKNYAASRPPISLDLLDLWIIDTFEADIPEIEGPTVTASGLVAFYKGPAMSPQDARTYAKRILIAADDADAVAAGAARPPDATDPRIAAIRAELGLAP